MRASSNSAWLATNLFVAALAIVLTLGSLELFVRTFVTVRNVGPAFTIYDPIYGKRLKPNLHATRIAPEFRIAINTNSLGMRDPEPTKPLTDGVVFVGDSFTMGYGVQDNEAFPALIRAGLEKHGVTMPVLNTGMGNNGNGRWVKFFEHDAAKFHPRIVVFQVMANDFDDNLAEHLFELGPDGRLRELPVAAPVSRARLKRLSIKCRVCPIRISWASHGLLPRQFRAIELPYRPSRGPARNCRAMRSHSLWSAPRWTRHAQREPKSLVFLSG